MALEPTGSVQRLLPSKLPQVIVPALLIFIWLTFVARPLSVALVLTPFRSKIKQQLLVSWILQNDVLVLSAITPDEIHGIKLVEKIIEKDSRYNNKLLSEISKKHNEIIIMIQRNGQVIIPNGNVRLTTGDILVINRAVN